MNPSPPKVGRLDGQRARWTAVEMIGRSAGRTVRRWLRWGGPTGTVAPSGSAPADRKPWNRVQGASVGSQWTNRLPIDLDHNVDTPLVVDGVDTPWGVAYYGSGAKVVPADSSLVVTDRGWVEPTNNMRFYVVLEVESGVDAGLRFVTEHVAGNEPEPMRHALASIVPDERT